MCILSVANDVVVCFDRLVDIAPSQQTRNPVALDAYRFGLISSLHSNVK